MLMWWLEKKQDWSTIRSALSVFCFKFEAEMSKNNLVCCSLSTLSFRFPWFLIHDPCNLQLQLQLFDVDFWKVSSKLWAAWPLCWHVFSVWLSRYDVILQHFALALGDTKFGLGPAMADPGGMQLLAASNGAAAGMGPDVIYVMCYWHEEEVDISNAYQNGRRWKCKDCYNAERWLQKKYSSENRRHIWAGMDFESRKKEVQSNRGSHSVQGVKRKYQCTVICHQLALFVFLFIPFSWVSFWFLSRYLPWVAFAFACSALKGKCADQRLRCSHRYQEPHELAWVHWILQNVSLISKTCAIFTWWFLM